MMNKDIEKMRQQLKAGYYDLPEIRAKIAELIGNMWLEALTMDDGGQAMGFFHQLTNLAFLGIHKAEYNAEGVEATVESLGGDVFKILIERVITPHD